MDILEAMQQRHSVRQYEDRKIEPAKTDGTMPDWFRKGMEAAMLAPTATNQQKFVFELHGDAVTAKVSGFGFYSGMDLGIVKYHFEAASGKRVG